MTPLLDEVPRYLRYDVFLSLLGVFIFYFTFTNTILSSSLTMWLASIMGACACLGYGLLEMKDNYYSYTEIVKLRYALEKKQILAKLGKNF